MNARRPIQHESLEPRLLLSGTTYVVDSLEYDLDFLQDGVVTYYEAFMAANQNAPYGDAPAGSPDEVDVITFDPALAGGVIDMRDFSIAVIDDVEIRGLGVDELTFDYSGCYALSTREGSRLHLSDVTVDGVRLMRISGDTTFERVAVQGYTEFVTSYEIATLQLPYEGKGKFTAIECSFQDISEVDMTWGSEVNLICCTIEGMDSLDGNGTMIFDSCDFTTPLSTVTSYGTLSVRDTELVGTYIQGVEIEIIGSELTDVGIETCRFEYGADVTAVDSVFMGCYISCGGGSAVLQGCAVIGSEQAGQVTGRAFISDGDITIIDSLVAHYGRDGSGDFGCAGSLTMINSVLWRNSGPTYEIGIDSDTPPLLINTIVGGYSSPMNVNLLDPASTNNVIEWTTSPIDDDPDNILGTLRHPIDVGLNVWVDAGQVQMTLDPSSPAIDAGASELAVDAAGNPLTTDFAGNPRIVGLGVDIGAVEFEYARGDADQDGDVDLTDFVALKTHFGGSSAEWGEGDFNGDGLVDLNDFLLLKRNFGYETPAAPSAPVEVQAEAVATETSATETAAPVWQEQAVADRSSRLGGRSVLEAMRARRLGEDGPGVLAVRPLQLAI